MTAAQCRQAQAEALIRLSQEHNLPTLAEARERGAAYLTAQGWTFVQESVEWVHPEGRRGRMTYHPSTIHSELIASVGLKEPIGTPPWAFLTFTTD
jgi:hypothetical protein